MERQIITTDDGSVTIHIPEMNESYHSKFGAIQEAFHVFIQNGLTLTERKPVSILEAGFGTGLNAFITFLESEKTGQSIRYTGFEAYPVNSGEVSRLNYVSQLNAFDKQSVFDLMHDCPWNEEINISENFTLLKRQQRFEEINDSDRYDLIYFDAFGYHAQPELWSVSIFDKMHNALKKNGILVTYACRSVIKNAMREAGFNTTKLPGPPGKREMLLARKL